MEGPREDDSDEVGDEERGDNVARVEFHKAAAKAEGASRQLLRQHEAARAHHGRRPLLIRIAQGIKIPGRRSQR